MSDPLPEKWKEWPQEFSLSYLLLPLSHVRCRGSQQKEEIPDRHTLTHLITYFLRSFSVQAEVSHCLNKKVGKVGAKILDIAKVVRYGPECPVDQREGKPRLIILTSYNVGGQSCLYTVLLKWAHFSDFAIRPKTLVISIRKEGKSLNSHQKYESSHIWRTWAPPKAHIYNPLTIQPFSGAHMEAVRANPQRIGDDGLDTSRTLPDLS